MSALAEALVAAQRRAVAQLEKEYVRSVQDDAEERAVGFRDALAAIGLTDRTDADALAAIGLTDRTDADALVNCLEVLRVTGGALPAEPTNGAEKKPDPPTQAQMDLIHELSSRHHLEAPDLPLTKQDASAIITAMKDGSYDAAKWKVPF